MARKRNGGYHPTGGKAAAPDRSVSRSSSVVSIDRTAMTGRGGLVVGTRVRILGSGLYAGELATVERLVAGPIPSAAVRTDAGLPRLARTVDLEPAPDAPRGPDGDRGS
jgi:hypothetical protein